MKKTQRAAAERGKRQAPWLEDASAAYLEVWNRLQSEGAPPDIATYQLLFTTLQRITVELSARTARPGEPGAPEAIADCLHAATVAAGITALNYWRAAYPGEPVPRARLRKLFDAAYRSIEEASLPLLPSVATGTG